MSNNIGLNWDSFIGHARQRQWFANAVARNRLASTFLFTGPQQIGKRTFANLVAKSLFCDNRPSRSFSVCNRCEGCIQVDAETHPDLILISKPPEKSTLPLELLVGSDENRMREGLCHDIRMKPFYGKRRIAIIDDADHLPTEAANSLLKTLEEPPAGSLIFLIATSEQRQLPTIRSRTQTVRFQRLSESDLSTLLLRVQLCETAEAAQQLSKYSDGTLALARQMQNDSTRKIREDLNEMLCQFPLPILKLTKTLEGALKEFGDDGQSKRDYFRMLTQFAIDTFRRQLLTTYSGKISCVPLSRTLHPAQATAAINLTLNVQSLIDRNLTAAGLIESWITQLSKVADVSTAKFG